MTVAANFQCYKAEDVSLPVQVYQADGVTAQNITGWSITFTAHQFSGPSLITKTVGSGITITNGTGGQLTVAIASADTAGLSPGNYLYSITRTDAGSEAVLTEGLMILLGD